MTKTNKRIKLPKVKVKFKLTADQAASVSSDRCMGLCVSCGEECSECEPDTRQRQCPSCGEFGVYGFEECLIRGWVQDEPDDEPKTEDVKPLREPTTDVFRGPTGHGKTLSVDAVLDSHFGRADSYDPASTKPADHVRSTIDWFRGHGWIIWRTGLVTGKRITTSAVSKFLLAEPDARTCVDLILSQTRATGKLTFDPSKLLFRASLDKEQHRRKVGEELIDVVRLTASRGLTRDVDAELWYFTLQQTGRVHEALQYYCNPHDYSVRIYAPLPDGSVLLVAIVMSLD